MFAEGFTRDEEESGEQELVPRRHGGLLPQRRSSLPDGPAFARAPAASFSTDADGLPRRRQILGGDDGSRGRAGPRSSRGRAGPRPKPVALELAPGGVFGSSGGYGWRGERGGRRERGKR